jgi:hypothetical protein
MVTLYAFHANSTTALELLVPSSFGGKGLESGTRSRRGVVPPLSALYH